MSWWIELSVDYLVVYSIDKADMCHARILVVWRLSLEGRCRRYEVVERI